MNASVEQARCEILAVIIHSFVPWELYTLFPLDIWSATASMTHASKSLPTENSPALCYMLENVDVSDWPNLIQVASTESLKPRNV